MLQAQNGMDVDDGARLMMDDAMRRRKTRRDVPEERNNEKEDAKHDDLHPALNEGEICETYLQKDSRSSQNGHVEQSRTVSDVKRLRGDTGGTIMEETEPQYSWT